MSDSAFGLKLLHPITTSDIAAAAENVDETEEEEVVINGAPFIGHFRLESHENFDEFLKAIGSYTFHLIFIQYFGHIFSIICSIDVIIIKTKMNE